MIRELDVVWFHCAVHACVRLNDCSAKLVEVSGDWTKAVVSDESEGVRLNPEVHVGEGFNGRFKGVEDFNPKDKLGMWLIGRLRPEQVTRSPSSMTSKGRTILGFVEVPMLGSARPVRRFRPEAEVESSAEGPQEEPVAPPVDCEASLLTALENAARSVVAILL
jgi:hypothetical protein